MYAVCVMFRIKPGYIDQFLPLMTRNAKASLRVEAECHRFDVATDSADPNAVFLYELYSDRLAFDAHLTSDHFLAFDTAVSAMIEDKTVVTWDKVLT